MACLDPDDIAVAKTIAAALPLASTTEEKGTNLTALVAITFAVANTLNIDPDSLITAMIALADTANEAIAELKNEGVNV